MTTSLPKKNLGCPPQYYAGPEFDPDDPDLDFTLAEGTVPMHVRAQYIIHDTSPMHPRRAETLPLRWQLSPAPVCVHLCT